MTILKLVHERDDGEADTYHLKPLRRYHIGRGSACEIRVLDMKMSRQHCALEFIDGHWNLLDLGSTNGVAIDGGTIRDRALILTTHQLDAGNSTFSVEVLGSADHQGDTTVGSLETDELGRHDSDLVPDTSAIPHTAALEAGRHTADSQGDDHDPADKAYESMAVPTPTDEPDETTGALTVRNAAVALTPADGQPTIPDTADIIHGDEDGPDEAADQPDTEAELDVPVEQMQNDGEDPGGIAATDQDEEPASLPSGPRRTPSGRIKPVTIRVGKGAKETSSDTHKRAHEETDDRMLYINVLGRRVGPMTRSQARDLKARELKGKLSEADLADFTT